MDADRINGLPEPILHDILSFLDMKEVVHTSLLSKSWRYLWLSLPNLNFDHRLWENNKNTTTERNQDRNEATYKDGFMDFVDNILLSRDNSININRFCLFSNFYFNSDRMETWINVVLQQHVQELYIQVSDCAEQPFELPNNHFRLPIRIFNSNLNQRRLLVQVQLPKSICSAAHLKTLKLVSVTLPSADSDGELILSCPILENLIIKNCDHGHLKVLNISAFQLKNLVVKNSYGIYVCSCMMRICTPNLTSFKLKGLMFKDFYLENLSSLVNANIEVVPDCFVKFVKELHNAKILTLSGWCIQTFSKSLCLLKWLPIPFQNLKYLKVTRLRRSSLNRAIVNVLESCPCIETLVLQLAKIFDFKNERGDWLGELSSHCIFNHLKSVEIKNLEGCENELKFLEYLLKNAVVLENITITTKETSSRDEEKEWAEFSEKLQLLPKASSSLTILFSLRTINI